MATIVTHEERGGRYVLLGGGYGAYKSTTPSFLLGSLAPKHEGAEYSLVLVGNAAGEVGWMEVSKIRLVSVDGQSPEEFLSDD